MDSFVYKPNNVPEFRRMKRTVMRNVIEMHVASHGCWCSDEPVTSRCAGPHAARAASSNRVGMSTASA